jgi:hypothetical protein
MEKREQKSGGAGCAVAGAIGFLFLVLYIFGVGPANWVARHYASTEQFVQLVYLPLNIAVAFFPPLGRALGWYVSYWM